MYAKHGENSPAWQALRAVLLALLATTMLMWFFVVEATADYFWLGVPGGTVAEVEAAPVCQAACMDHGD